MIGKKQVFVFIGAFMISALITAMPVHAVNGPRADLEYLFYSSTDAAWGALNLGQIDLLADMLTGTQYLNAIANPSITVTPKIATNRIWTYAFNCNYTLETAAYKYPIQNPAFDTNFRKAMACCVDVAAYIAGVWQGLGYKNDVPLRKDLQMAGWANESLVDALGGHYPYNYNLTKAREYLTAGGWIDRSGPGGPTTPDGIVDFPLDWPGVPNNQTNRDIYPIPFLCEWYYPPERQNELKYYIIPAINSVLGPNIVTIEIPLYFDSHTFLLEHAVFACDGWATGDAPTDLESYYHSREWGVTNTYTGGPGDGSIPPPGYMPWQDEIDVAVDDFYYETNLTLCKQKCKYLQYLVVDKYCFWMSAGITTEGVYAYRNLLGVVTSPNTGPDNFYSEMNWMRVDDPTQPIRIGTYTIPVNFNPWVSSLAASRAFVYCWDPHFSAVNNPYRPFDWSMFAGCGAQKDWEDPTLTWVDPEDGLTKDISVYYLNPNAKWVHPINGSVFYTEDYYDYQFTAWYWIQTRSPNFYSREDFCTIKFIRPGKTAGVWDFSVVQAYLGNPDYYMGHALWWFKYPWYTRGLCRKAWENSPFVTGPITKVYVEGTNITTPGFATTGVVWRKTGAPVDLISVVGDSGGGNITTLSQYTASDVNFEMRFDPSSYYYYPYIYYKFAPGTKITLKYWGRGTYYGNTPGDVGLEKTLYGSGPYYLLSYDTSLGFSWKRNTNYKLETPPLGEVDWTWYWEGTTKPRAGYMQIKIYDIVKIATAYGTIGSAKYGPNVPSPGWITSADMAATGGREGKIDIYDIVTACTKYGQKFWITP